MQEGSIQLRQGRPKLLGLTRRTSQAFSPCMFGFWISRIRSIMLSNLSTNCSGDLDCSISQQPPFLGMVQNLLSPFTSIPEVIPILNVQALLLSQLSDFFGRQAFIIPIIPFSQFRRDNSFGLEQSSSRGRRKHQLVCLTGPLHWAYKDQSELYWVNQHAITNQFDR